jgi:hypothetical protein
MFDDSSNLKSLSLLGGIILLLTASIAYADVSCSITLSNSDGSTTDAVTISDAYFSSGSILLPSEGINGLPYSILSTGSGTSTSSSGKFSESVTVSGGQKPGNMDANVDIRNGAFSWSKKVNIGSISPDTSMKIKTMISDGILESSYSNSFSMATKEINTERSKYSDKTTITPQLVDTIGGGASKEDIGNGFSSHLEGETADRRSVMDTLLFERSEEVGAANNWKDQIHLNPENGFMMQSATIMSENKCRLSDDQLGTDGQGQILVGMKFTPYDINTMNQLFETQFVPATDSGFRVILVRPRVDENEPSYYDFKTLRMFSKWPIAIDLENEEQNV